MNKTIELSENSIQILDKQELTDKHIVIIRVDVGNLPTHKATEYLNDIKTAFVNKVVPAELIVMSSKNTVEVFKREESK